MQPRNSKTQPSSSQSAFLAQGVYATLFNPYAPQQIPAYPLYSSHYAQAYLQSYQATTSEGYTLSSSYNPALTSNMPNVRPNINRTANPPSASSTGHSSNNNSWYQPGSIRCGSNGCSFVGSAKSVEVHKMDRHLIYPPGWEKRKKRQEWDADPSLKGKQIPIQGTTIVLDSPEVLEAWIAERKQRWPSSGRVEEKKRKLQEAADRGQLSAAEISLHPAKRQKVANRENLKSNNIYSQRFRHPASQTSPSTTKYPPTTNPKDMHEPLSPSLSPDKDDSDDDGMPDVVSSKISVQSTDAHTALMPTDPCNRKTQANGKKPQPLSSTSRQLVPKQQPRNPFSFRPTLLHNLLLPEIRVTISNLSQAIRFLVDNNFLDDVEVTPGESDAKMIQVLEN